MRPRNIFRNFAPAGDDLSNLRAYVLVEATNNGRVEDSMWISLQGTRPVTAKFRAEQISIVTSHYMYNNLKRPGTLYTMVHSDQAWHHIYNGPK